jgi:hypothetical protein
MEEAISESIPTCDLKPQGSATLPLLSIWPPQQENCSCRLQTAIQAMIIVNRNYFSTILVHVIKFDFNKKTEITFLSFMSFAFLSFVAFDNDRQLIKLMFDTNHTNFLGQYIFLSIQSMNWLQWVAIRLSKASVRSARLVHISWLSAVFDCNQLLHLLSIFFFINIFKTQG